MMSVEIAIFSQIIESNKERLMGVYFPVKRSFPIILFFVNYFEIFCQICCRATLCLFFKHSVKQKTKPVAVRSITISAVINAQNRLFITVLIVAQFACVTIYYIKLVWWYSKILLCRKYTQAGR